MIGYDLQEWCAVKAPKEAFEGHTVKWTGTDSCMRAPYHWGKRHHCQGWSHRIDPPVEWGEPLVEPTWMTAEQAAGQATGTAGECPSRDGAINPGHFMRVLPLGWRAYRGERYPGAQRWRLIRVGRVCDRCWDHYDPTPYCLCGNKARYQEDDGLWYCGTHSPTRRDERQAKRDDVWKAKYAAIDERRDARTMEQRAERELLAEAAQWRDDEQATEGFCDDDCEHHECRLARAVARYERAHEALEQLRATQ